MTLRCLGGCFSLCSAVRNIPMRGSKPHLLAVCWIATTRRRGSRARDLRPVVRQASKHEQATRSAFYGRCFPSHCSLRP
ncbi:hypothetical protein K523DRAFT_25414 [Schizophyllum commune Tattone D]|nr:hypothetical protein K523DRAFT_25414 [Schizophyllum commune Tattone D]